MSRSHFSLLIEARSGSGKSYLMALLLSFLHRLKPEKLILIIDPQYEHELPGYYEYELTPSNYREKLKRLPTVLLRYKRVILHFDEMNLTDIKKLADVISHIVYRLGNTIFVMDEAHLVVSKNQPAEYAVLNAVMGRKRGIDTIYISQRPQQLATVIRSQTNFKLIGPMDDETDIKMVGSYLGKYKTFLNTLPERYFFFKDKTGKIFLTTTEGWKVSHHG